MGQINIEERLHQATSFLGKYSRGVIDNRKPQLTGLFFDDLNIALVLSMNPELTIAVASGEYSYPPVDKIPDDKLQSFLKEYKKVWFPEKEHRGFIKGLVDYSPDVILDLCVGDGSDINKNIEIIRRKCGKDIKVIGVDNNLENLLKAKKKNMPGFEYYFGRVTDKGDIKVDGYYGSAQAIKPFSKENVLQDKKIAVYASNACGQLSDYIGNFIVKNNIGYFIIFRCCYNGLNIRSPLNKGDSKVRINQQFLPLLIEAYNKDTKEESIHLKKFFLPSTGVSEIPEHPISDAGNLIFVDLVKQIISLDLALFMKKKDTMLMLKEYKDVLQFMAINDHKNINQQPLNNMVSIFL